MFSQLYPGLSPSMYKNFQSEKLLKMSNINLFKSIVLEIFWSSISNSQIQLKSWVLWEYSNLDKILEIFQQQSRIYRDKIAKNILIQLIQHVWYFHLNIILQICLVFSKATPLTADTPLSDNSLWAAPNASIEIIARFAPGCLAASNLPTQLFYDCSSNVKHSEYQFKRNVISPIHKLWQLCFLER